MVGIIQEQHPDRCKLFMQWKRMNWPVMVDALNLLEVKVVPLTFLIDEHGVIRAKARRPGDVEAWLKEPPPEGEPPASRARASVPSPEQLRARQRVAGAGDFESRMALARDLFLWGGDALASEAVAVFERIAESRPDDGRVHFRLGVAHRKSFDLDSHDEEDFKQAVESWQTALNADPNQYIWRRRIQQYGPRLMKPYSFYDWVTTARAEIEARGEQPVKLSVEPGGAEFATPQQSFSSEPTTRERPDPDGRILRDRKGFIQAAAVVVPSEVAAGGSVRVHVSMTPATDPKIRAHWNNEVDDTVLWVDAPGSWRVDRPWHSAPRPQSIVSQETRRVEFELRVPDDAPPGKHAIPAYALYYVCEKVDSACLYRRQEIRIPVRVGGP